MGVVGEEDLNNSSGFSFPVPPKWRSSTGTSTSSHSGHISILLGGDNHLFFCTEVERNSQGVALYQSNLTEKFLIYGSVSSNIITWTEPLISTSTNTIYIKSLTVQDLQDQLLLTTSAEDFTNPATRSELVQLTKEKGIQAIMKNTNVDTLNHKVSIQYIYKENLVDLGKNFYGATKNIHALHNKISDKPEIVSEIDKYIQEQVDNGNYVEINIEDARKENQLHFVGYNFVVSATSSSTKVRMTTDSSMQTETGLSLNEVTQPAPGDVPSL